MNSDELACWHIMTTTFGGTISLLKNLDAPTARLVYRSLKPSGHPVKRINLPSADDPDFSGGFSWTEVCRHVGDSDIASVEILGPEGVDLEPWRGVKPRIIDMAPEVERQRVEIRNRRREEIAQELESALCAPDWSVALAHVHAACALLNSASGER